MTSRSRRRRERGLRINRVGVAYPALEVLGRIVEAAGDVGAVRKDHVDLRKELDGVLERRRSDVQALLANYHVPEIGS